MECEICKNRLDPGNRICSNCGAKYSAVISALGKVANGLLLVSMGVVFIAFNLTNNEISPIWIFLIIMLFSIIGFIVRVSPAFKKYKLDLSNEQTAIAIKLSGERN